MDREYVMVKGVIFDMDGLMFDTEPVWGENLKPATDALGLAYKPGLSDAVRGTAGGEFAKVVHAWYDESVNADELWDVWHAIVEEHLRAGVEKKPGLDELLAYLGEQGIPAAVASSSPASQIAQNLENAGVSACFSATVSGLEVEHAKPEPDVFIRAAELLGCDAHEALVLEDSFNGVRAGAAGGFITVMVPDLVQPDDEMRSLATRICRDLFEVRDLLQAGAIG